MLTNGLGAHRLFTGVLALVIGGGGGAAASPAPSQPSAPPAASQAATNPFAGARPYVDPDSHAAHEVTSDPANATDWHKIADHAQADWFGDWYPTSTLTGVVRNRVQTIRRAGALPVFVVYAIPQRDCGGYSAGGVNTAADYSAWVSAFAAGLDGQPAVVVLEPDALAGLDCLSAAGQSARLTMLAGAVTTLAPKAAVYLDAGNSGWQPAATMAQRLRSAGLASARGFALNVSNYLRTGDEVAYGKAVLAALGTAGTGKGFLVDTSRNGQGPTPQTDSSPSWCNQPGAGLGTPATAVGSGGVDGYFWVKRPGESDGACHGWPAAGQWYAPGALALAQNAAF